MKIKILFVLIFVLLVLFAYQTKKMVEYYYNDILGLCIAQSDDDFSNIYLGDKLYLESSETDLDAEGNIVSYSVDIDKNNAFKNVITINATVDVKDGSLVQVVPIYANNGMDFSDCVWAKASDNLKISSKDKIIAINHNGGKIFNEYRYNIEFVSED